MEKDGGNEVQKGKQTEFYRRVNAKLKNRALLDISDADRAKLLDAKLADWRKRVNDVDLLYADALYLGGWEFLQAFLAGEMGGDFFISMVKALRKREARHDAKLIRVILTTGAVAQGGKKTKRMIDKVDRQVNKDAE